MLRATRRLLSERSLLGDFILLQLVFASVVGAAAVGGLWWTSNWVVRENVNKWAIQWADRLDSLAAPLYLSLDQDAGKQVRDYVANFSEIAFVRYYDAGGDLIHGEGAASENSTGNERLSQQELLELTADRNVIISSSAHDGEHMRVCRSLWAKSIVNDGLFGFDLEEPSEEEQELLGFVELGLDFQTYRAGMTRRVLRLSLGVLIALFVLGVGGMFWFRRALQPLRNLKEPLSRLARGELDLDVPDGGHAELIAINDALATTISALHQRDQRMREAANFDPLTGLMSRLGLHEELDREIERARVANSTAAVLFVDLDQFKYVNDTVGHAAGDRLLIRVANQFRSLVGKEDLLCRYGGDEFIVLQRGATRDAAEHLAYSIVDAMRAMQFVEDGRAFNVRCSIGVAMVDGSAVKPEEILAQADMACHEAKGQGRNRFQIFSCQSGEREQTAADMGWSERIREALALDAFSLRYQPIINIEHKQVELYEVLLRMRGQGRKMIPPGAFLPAADRFGLMGDLDYWVIRKAFARLAEVRAERPGTIFALNLSGIAFSDPRLVDYVEEQLQLHGLPGAAIVFEITEQVAIRHIETASAIMRELIDKGCRFALDDFGAGFSSFNYLKQLPVSFIKIDGTFIENLATDPSDRAIVTSISQIARTLGTQTVAEHVRDEKTLQILREIGIDLAQGYYLGRPRISLESREIQPI